MLTYESSKVSISALPHRKFPRTKMLNLEGLRYVVIGLLGHNLAMGLDAQQLAFNGLQSRRNETMNET